MNNRNLGRIEEYTRNSNNMNVKNKFSTIVDAFQYAEDDLSLLRRVFRRMRIEPKVASALCALCIGYEEIINDNGMSAYEQSSFDDTLVDIVRASTAAANTRARSVSESNNQFDTIRTAITSPGQVDQVLSELSDIADLSEDECIQNGHRFNGYKCDVRPSQQNRCGLTTSMNCRKGSLTGQTYCESVPGTNRCRLSNHGKNSKDRKTVKRQIDNRFQDARRTYLGR